MLKLIVSQTNHSLEIPAFSKENAKLTCNEPFRTSLKVQGPFLYVMTAQDPSHYLTCDILLEIENTVNEHGSNTVICHFPAIEDEKLSCCIEDEATLMGIILIQFQMNVLTQLLRFCEIHHTSKLIIFADDDYADCFGIYREFLSCGTYNPDVQQGSEFIFNVDHQVIHDWKAYMDQINLRFRQTLWQEQRKNIIIKNYLKTHPF